MTKRVTLILAALLMVASAFGAKKEKKSSDFDTMEGSKFGAEVGYNHTWHYAESAIRIAKTKENLFPPAAATIGLNGFYIGPTYTYYFQGAEGLYVKGTLLYQYGAANITKDDVSALVFDLTRSYEEIADFNRLKFITHTIEIPVRVGYNYTFQCGVGVNVFAGASVDFGLDWKIDGSDDSSNGAMHLLSGRMEYNHDGVKTTRKEDYLKSYNIFNLGLGGGVGMTYKFIYLNLSCDWGISNLCKHASFATSLDGTNVEYSNKSHITELKLSVGCKF